MGVRQCNRCGKMIHDYSPCYHCGESVPKSMSQADSIHPNVSHYFIKAITLLSEKKYDAVLTCCTKVIEWSPRCSEIYWLRLLAENHCSSDYDLVLKGINFQSNPNYKNAVKYANENEAQVYTNVKSMIELLGAQLRAAVESLGHEKKQSLNLPYVADEMRTEMMRHEDKLFSLWQELVQIEQTMYSLETDCHYITKEHIDSLNATYATATQINADASKFDELTDVRYHDFHSRIDSVLQQSNQSRGILDNMKTQHPRVKRFNELVSERENKIRDIQIALNALKTYEAKLAGIALSYEKIDKECKTMYHQIQNGDYSQVRSIIGETSFETAVHNIGIRH